MPSRRQGHHCSFCRESGHTITNCHSERLTDFEFVCASEVQKTETPNIFKDWLMRTYANEVALIQAFAIRKSRPGNSQHIQRITLRSSIGDCVDVIANYMFMYYKDSAQLELDQSIERVDDTTTRDGFTHDYFANFLNDLSIDLEQPLTLEDLDVPAVAELPNVLDLPQPTFEYDPSVTYDPNIFYDPRMLTETLLIAEAIIRNPDVLNRSQHTPIIIGVIEARLYQVIDVLRLARDQATHRVKLRIETAENEQLDQICKCSICWDEKELVNFVSLDCRHEFCKDCVIATTVHNQGVVPCCALCRGEVRTIVSRTDLVHTEIAGAVR
jgi:hypothetical protein